MHIKTKKRNDTNVLNVLQFIEKPNLSTAEEFIQDKNYFWNAGIFVVSANQIVESFIKINPILEKSIKIINQLSGGEKARLALALIVMKPSNFLLLDEPDNHLDLDSKLLLSNLLNQYKGGYILVSHDEVFVKSLVRTKVVNFYK